MTDEKNAEIVTTAVYNKLRDMGDVLHVPLKDEDVDIITKDAVKIIKAQQLVKKRLAEFKLLR